MIDNCFIDQYRQYVKLGSPAVKALPQEPIAAAKGVSEENADLWTPKYGEEYWTVRFGRVLEWMWCGDGGDCEALNADLVFRTREEAKAARAELNADLGASKEKANPWRPGYGEEYWTVRSSGYAGKWTWLGGEDDREQLDAGLVFRTCEEAENALAKMHGQPPEAPPELTVDDLAPGAG